MSFPYNIYNEEYRDAVNKSNHPFTDTATLNNGILAIPMDAFIDILIYAVGDYMAPFYIAAIDGIQGEEGQALVTIKDSRNTVIGTAMLDRNVDTCYFKQGNSIQAGVFVYNKDVIEQLLGELGDNKTVYTNKQTEIIISQCYVVKPGNLELINGNTRSWTGDVNIIADNGVTFEPDGDGIAVSIYGEEPDTGKALKSINGESFPDGHVWLSAHPDSSLRVIKENIIKHTGDIDYGE